MKTYNTTNNVGKARYAVNFHDGKSTYKDGSPFYDIRIFNSKAKRDAFTESLEDQGYQPT